MQPRPFPNDVLVIDDTYNANPQSMQSALETLARLETRGRRIAVLGQMGELGDADETAHRDIGRLAGRLGLDALVLLGASAEHAAQGAREAGLAEARIHVAADHDSVASTLASLIGAGDRVLVKGSRAARMERVIELLAEGGH
jgi:UDP-N-acetylmuramoyl-tripeptide--D-alanyl-D-alanine ligase